MSSENSYPSTLYLSDRLNAILSKIDNLYAAKLRNYNNYKSLDEASQWVNFLDVSNVNPSMISYVDKKRYDAIINSTESENIFQSDKRYRTSLGKLLYKLSIEIEEPEFSKFYNQFKALADNRSFESLYHLDFVKENDLIYWYSENNYHSGSGSLNSSCMRYSYCDEYLQFYAENSDKISMFIATCDNLLVGRCLIWEDKYFDRVYGINEYVESQIILYLKDKGFTDVYSSSDSVTIRLKKGYGNFNYYPYCDTFKFLSETKISNNELSNYILELRCADGNCQDDYVMLYNSSRAVHIDDACYISYINAYAYLDDCVYCKHSQEYVIKEDSVQLYNGDYAHYNEVVDLYTGDYALHEDTVELYNGQYALCDEVVKLYNENYALEDEVVKLYNGQYALENEVVKLEDGTYALSNNENLVENDN